MFIVIALAVAGAFITVIAAAVVLSASRAASVGDRSWTDLVLPRS